MLLRMSTLFLRTRRDDPADAEVASYRLLVRAGYIRRAAPGFYTWLPLGVHVLRRVETIVREELERAGAQELRPPASMTAGPDEAVPSAVEVFARTVKAESSSYRDLPWSLYRMQTQFRREARAGAGILDSHEVLVNDACSFDADEEGLRAAYDRYRETYVRILDRLKLSLVPGDAGAFAAGGAGGVAVVAGEALLFPHGGGPDTFVRCASCGYTADLEVATVASAESLDAPTAPATRVIETPDAATIDALVAALNAGGEVAPTGCPWTAADTLKNLVVMVKGPDGMESPLALGIPGDRDADLRRVASQLGAVAVRPFDAEDFAAHPGIVPGYLGPARLGTNSPSHIPYLVDVGVAPGRRWVAGADEPDRHSLDVIRGRDFTPDGEIQATEVRSGDACARCGGSLRIERGVKIGQLARLGTDAAESFGLSVLDGDGKPVAVAIGAYRLGISQAVAAVAEQHHDDKGLSWPAAVAPADVHIVAVGRDDAPFDAAVALAGTLDDMGMMVLLDDRRAARPGVKFADAELIGVPVTVVVGKGLANNQVEVRERRTAASRDVHIDAAAAYILELSRD